ncbi:MAG TPA: hypothetical protein VNF47_21655 [Streptosporangiaceae bacterium]|nr:hypothetical protein [Streptosporangiaceae bacterium]
MARILVFTVAAIAILVLLWILFWGILHTLLIGFWVLLVAMLAIGMFRVGRWSRRGSRS